MARSQNCQARIKEVKKKKKRKEERETDDEKRSEKLYLRNVIIIHENTLC